MGEGALVGETLLHYRLVSQLGKGGMGEVYVAEDAKLGRRVALKVLPPEMAADGERRARFEREARAVAALNHPNIVTLHSVEEADGVHFLTMELVEGKTLTRLIPAEGMPLSRILDLAIPLADALAAAHEKGILHRDLKPDNIMIGADGRPKILDFGLAKLREDLASGVEAATQLPTQSVTADGRIVGTVAYMSPEQAEAKPLDPRSDIFALGVILYEMATGRRPFRGETTMSTLTSIIRDDPEPVHGLKPGLPRHLARIIRRCLAKEITRRTQTALDVRNELEELRAEIASGEPAAAPPAAGRPSRRTPWVVAGVLLTALAAVVAWTVLRPASAPGGEALLEPFEATMAPLTDVGGAVEPHLSPDGRMLLYVAEGDGGSDVYLQRVGGEKPINLTADYAGDDFSPAFSPDGERIAFVSEREGGGIFVMGATGESPRRVVDAGYHPAWSPDGSQILFTNERVVDPYQRWLRAELRAVDLETGETRLVDPGDAVEGEWSPDGRRIAFWAVDGGQRDIWTVPAAGGERVAVTDDPHTDWGPIWSPDGRYLYFLSDRGGTPDLWRVRVDASSGEALAPPQAVTAGVAAVLEAAISGDGSRIAYTAGNDSGELQRVPLDASALRAGPPEILLRSAGVLNEFALSPDGQWIAYTTTAPQEDLYVMRADGTGRRQITNDPHRDRGPRYSPDGTRIVMYSNRSGRYELWEVRPDGTGLRSLTAHLEHKLTDPEWSDDGRYLSGGRFQERYISVILDLGVDGAADPAAAAILTDHEIPDFTVTGWSPDGKWLAGTFVGSGEGDMRLAIYSVDDRRLREVLDPDGAPFRAYGRWMSDSRRLLFADFDRREVLIWDRPTGEVNEVKGLGAWDDDHFWLSADDRWLLIQRVQHRSDVWLLTLRK